MHHLSILPCLSECLTATHTHTTQLLQFLPELHEKPPQPSLPRDTPCITCHLFPCLSECLTPTHTQTTVTTQLLYFLLNRQLHETPAITTLTDNPCITCLSHRLTLTPTHATQPLSLLFTAIFLRLIHQNNVTMCFSKTINTLLNVTLPISLLATPDTMVPCHVQHYHLIVPSPSVSLYVQSGFNTTFIYIFILFIYLCILSRFCLHSNFLFFSLSLLFHCSLLPLYNFLIILSTIFYILLKCLFSLLFHCSHSPFI